MLPTGPRQILLLGTDNGDSTFTGVTSGTSVPINASGFDQIAVALESVGTTSGGTIVIEEASRRNYSGTWSQIASIAASSFTGGVQTVYHIAPIRAAWMRVRISSNITGGGKILAFLGEQGS